LVKSPLGTKLDGDRRGGELDPDFKGKTAEWIAKTAEDFYLSLGFQPLPGSFWIRSDLYPAPKDSKRKKEYPRVVFPYRPRTRHQVPAKHRAQLGMVLHRAPRAWHGHYFAAFTRPEVPMLLRLGANPGFHEGVGELGALASSQVPYLQAKGILPADFKADQTAFLLNDALASSVPFIFSPPAR
jgi:peptidyl-dipeptidase A